MKTLGDEMKDELQHQQWLIENGKLYDAMKQRAEAAEARAAALERQVAAQQREIKAASDMIEWAYVVLGNGDFKNGVTDNSGTIDEGEVYASHCFEAMRQWLLNHETTKNYVKA